MLFAPVQERLLATPDRFDFFQATYLLERFAGQYALGSGVCAQADAVQFKASAQLGYSGAVITSVQSIQSGQSVQSAQSAQSDEAARNCLDKKSKNDAEKSFFEMTVNGFGILGAEGVMPLHYSEWVAAQARQGPSVLMAFIDLFHQRCFTLMYLAWKKYRFPARTGAVVERAVKSSVGVSPKPARQQAYQQQQSSASSVRAHAIARARMQYAGVMARGQMGPETLSRLLSDYFNLSIIVQDFQGAWAPISKAFLTRLAGRGQSPQRLEHCSQHRPQRRARRHKHQACLGVNTILGERAWQVQSKVLISVTCNSRRDFEAFSPAGDACQYLVMLLQYALGSGVSADLALIVQRAHLPAPVLARQAQTVKDVHTAKTEPVLRLGQNSVLRMGLRAGGEANGGAQLLTIRRCLGLQKRR